MDSNPSPRLFHVRFDRAWVALFFLGAAGYALFLYREGSPYAGGSDSSGYLNSARLLDQGQLLAPIRALANHGPLEFGPRVFQPLGFMVHAQGEKLAPTYPVGLPLHLMLAARWAGWDRAALIVNIFAAVGAGGMTWILARRFEFPHAWAALAVAWLWFSPQLVFSSLQPMSDSLALLWSLIVLETALRSRASFGWSMGCGVALAMAVLVRPTNALLLLPVAVALGFRPLAWLALGLGGLPGALFLSWYNQQVYGAILTTGYGDIRDFLGIHYLGHNLIHLARWLSAGLTPLVWGVLALPFLRSRWTREAVVLSFWVVLLVGFYAFYSYTSDAWWYLRFILPAFPLLILGAIAVWRKIPLVSHAASWSGLGISLAVILVWEIEFNRGLHATAIRSEEETYPQAASWVTKNIPANSAICCLQVSGAFYFYTDFMLVRWDIIEGSAAVSLLNTLREQHRPLYAVLYDYESAGARAKFGGNWTPITAVGHATIWRREN